METKVGLCREPTQFQSGQAKLFSIVWVDIKRVVREVTAEDIPVVSLRGCTPPPHPSPLNKIHHFCCTDGIETAWVSRLGEEKQNEMSLFHA